MHLDCKNVEWEAPQRIDTRSLPANEVATPRLNDVEALARKTIMGSAGWIVCEEIPGSISFRRIVVRNPIMVELMSFRFRFVCLLSTANPSLAHFVCERQRRASTREYLAKYV
jgi:hypothetical protein